IHKLNEEYSTSSGDDKCHSTQEEYLNRIGCQEFTGLRRATYSQSEQHDYDIIHCTACRLSQTCSLTRFLEQVTEEQHTQQRKTRWNDECRKQQSDDREENTFCLTHLTGRFHVHNALFLCRKQTHHWRLDNRYQCHVRISTYSDSTHYVRTQFAA